LYLDENVVICIWEIALAVCCEKSNLSNLFFKKISLLLCWVGVHCYIYTSSHNVSNISYMNSFSLLLSFILPSLNSWSSYNRNFCTYIIFLHLYSCVHTFCTISTLLPSFLAISPLSLVPTLLRWDFFHPLVLWFYRRKQKK
jgi:hypothetical protein